MTSPPDLSDASRLLLDLGGSLGIAADTWAPFEQLTAIQRSTPDLQRETVRRLDLDAVRSVMSFFQGSLDCLIHLDYASQLSLSPTLTQAELAAFLEDTRESPTLSLDL